MILDKYKLTRWARIIKLRDKGRCYMCDNSHPIKELNAHHIYPKADIRYSFKAYNLDNGISLCWRCHRELVHSGWVSWRKYVAMFRNRMRSKNNKKFNKKNQVRIK